MSSSEQDTKKKTLFEYTEDELLHDHVLTHYQVLNVAEHAPTEAVKKAYRKASLKYHPDKTGRGDNDYVFLAVKHAHDVLMNPEKRQAYDSTTLPFDDAIPGAFTTTDTNHDEFYETFGPVFSRNLRFDARLRPENSSNNNKNKNKNKNKGSKKPQPPSLGDDTSSLQQVHAFYEYWVHFESWRDFSATAADELQVENELENAESRFEKRWIQKEVDKRAKQLKKIEMARIQQLVERAMEADPRLIQERRAAVAKKEQAKLQRELEVQRKKDEQAAAAERKRQEALEEQERKAQEKVQREKEKKVLRKARQQLRKMTSASFEEYQSSSEHELLESSSSSPGVPSWKDSYDMTQDVEILCMSLNLVELKNLIETYEKQSEPNEALILVHQRVLRLKQEQQDEQEEQKTAQQQQQNSTAPTAGANKLPPWTKEELSALAKAVKKYPPGGSSRWEQIAVFVNNLCCKGGGGHSRSKEECIEKYNNIARSGKSAAAAATPAATKAGAAATSPSSAGGAKADSGTSAATDESGWTGEQDQQLQDALKQYPASLDKNERWTKIAKAVTGKTKKQCVQRFKAIREALMAKK